MNTKNYFSTARKIQYAKSAIFYLVSIISLILLSNTLKSAAEWFSIALICLTISSPSLSFIQRIIQVRGNNKLREGQLRDAFNVPVGEAAKQNYYNSDVTPSIRRLGATTLENSKFSIAVLSRMLIKIRVKTLAYAIVFIILISCRQTHLNVLLVITQSIFSVNVVFDWLVAERLKLKIESVYEKLRQHFLESGKRTSPASTAVILNIFINYECSKDEAVVIFDEKVFNSINGPISAEWELERKELGI